MMVQSNAPSDAALTAVAEDYVKVVWNAAEWSDEPVTVKHLAERMGVSASTVSDHVRRLRDQGLLDHAKYGAITLTDAGTRHALAMVRRHRLIETFLVNTLGYGWDEVHDEAEVLEHSCSDRMIDAMDEALGYPTRDPHGDPIPTADGTIQMPDATMLAHAAAGEWTITRISDSDPALLRYLDTVELTLDADIRVLPAQQFDDAVRVAHAKHSEALSLGVVAASALWVIPRS
jgi:DtxR family Mn-dependent transcriptional regulator